MTDAAQIDCLEPNSMLLWYRIERILGRGGFGVTYLATDTNLDREVAIKEYFPTGLVTRDRAGKLAVASNRDQFAWGLQRFIAEGQTLARFDHPGIVRVNAVFEENHTAYMVMQFERGESLADRLQRVQCVGESITQHVLADICKGLKAIHDEGFLHRDIKPSNILLRKRLSAVLIDFGSSREALNARGIDLTTLVSPGYAPIEQYSRDGEKQGPWTDIYALGATAYRMLTGVAPPPAIDRSQRLLDDEADPLRRLSEITTLDASPAFCSAIDAALSFRTKDRPQDVESWQRLWSPTDLSPAIIEPDTEQLNLWSSPENAIDSEKESTTEVRVVGKESGITESEFAEPPAHVDTNFEIDQYLTEDPERETASAQTEGSLRLGRTKRARYIGIALISVATVGLISSRFLGGVAPHIDPNAQASPDEDVPLLESPPDPAVVISETIESSDMVAIGQSKKPPRPLTQEDVQSDQELIGLIERELHDLNFDYAATLVTAYSERVTSNPELQSLAELSKTLRSYSVTIDAGARPDLAPTWTKIKDLLQNRDIDGARRLVPQLGGQ